MKLRHLGIFGIISLLSYTAMVLFSPLAYPGYDWMSMAVSDLSAVGAPSAELAHQLNALFGPCAIVSVMGVCVGVSGYRFGIFKTGIYSYVMMEWLCTIGYSLFPWVQDESITHIQNLLHLGVTVLVVLLSLIGLIFIAFGAKKEGIESLSVWAVICLAAMVIGPLGTSLLPRAVFGLFERFSTFSAVVFNAVLGIYLWRGRFEQRETGKDERENERQDSICSSGTCL